MEFYLGGTVLFGGNFAPRGWTFCKGQLMSISENTALFAILGTTWGGDGRTNFATPDLRSRAPVGTGRGNGLTDISEGEDFLTETTVTPHMHKVGLDFMLDHSPFSGGSQQYGGTLQLQSSYTYCHNGEDEFCKEDLYIGASLFMLKGRWGF